ncbi:MAG TPA: hypothetical protein VM686_25320 [Polyangiaceae bacterium]|nr:hypothetical protein [Polyangiaceae bacterium]
MRFVLALLLVGCSSTSDALRARFAREHGCPQRDVRVTEAGANHYSASGCEQQAVYVCDSTGGFGDPGARCVEQGLARRGPPETDGRRVPSPDPRIQEPPR